MKNKKYFLLLILPALVLVIWAYLYNSHAKSNVTAYKDCTHKTISVQQEQIIMQENRSASPGGMCIGTPIYGHYITLAYSVVLASIIIVVSLVSALSPTGQSTKGHKR